MDTIILLMLAYFPLSTNSMPTPQVTPSVPVKMQMSPTIQLIPEVTAFPSYDVQPTAPTVNLPLSSYTTVKTTSSYKTVKATTTTTVHFPIFTQTYNFTYLKPPPPQATPSLNGSDIDVENYCNEVQDPIWNLTWPNTTAGSFAFVPCPEQFQGFARRRCTLLGNWLLPDLSQCFGENVQAIKNEAKKFFKKKPNIQGALYLVNQLSNLTMPGGMKMPLASDDLNTINFVIGQTVNLLLQEGGPGSDQGTDIVDALNNALGPQNVEGWSNLQQSQSGSEELLSNAEAYAKYLARAINNTNKPVWFSRENLAIRAKRFSVGDKFTDSVFPSDDDLVNTSYIDSVHIVIPAAYLEAQANSASDGEVSVAHILFPSLQDFLPTADNESSPASVIISSQVVTSDNETITNSSILLETPIELTFSLNVTYNASTERIIPQCVYWNFSSNFNSTNYGGWVSDNIVTSDELINETVVKCYSNHLTSFAVLVSVVEQDDLANGTSVEEHFLSILSYIGCSISIVCLLATVICLLTMKKELIQKPIHFIHFNLSIALLVALILFVSTVETATAISGLCKAVTFLMHYFFLSIFSWMLCEAIMLYLLIVVVFSPLAKKWWLYLLLGWGLPIIPVTITFGVKYDMYTSEYLCWLNADEGVIWGFVGPVLGVICINTVILVIALIKISKTVYLKERHVNKDKKADKKIEMDNKHIFNLIKNIAILMPLLGITWIFGIFAVNENTTVFAWIFVILNSLQGAFIFLLHVFKGPLIWGRFIKWHKRHKRQHTISRNSLVTTKSSYTASELTIL